MQGAATPASAGGFTFAVGNIPVRVRATFFVTAVLLGLTTGHDSAAAFVVWVSVVFASVLWHELGHALAAICFGGKPEIELHGCGGTTDCHAAGELRWWQDVIISVAGPIAGLLAGGVLWLFARVSPPESATVSLALSWALWANVGWSLCNLLPIIPFDGGLALRAGLMAQFSRSGEIAAYIITVIVGGAACGFALSVANFWAAYLAGFGAVTAVSWLGHRRIQQRIHAAWNAIHTGQREAAATEVAAIMRGSVEPQMLAGAVEMSSWIAVHDGDAAAARDVLNDMPHLFHPSDLLTATIDTLEGKDTQAAARELDQELLLGEWSHLEASLFYAGKYEASLAIATRGFEIHGKHNSAYNAACCLSRLGRPDTALPWLERAIEAGFRDLPHLQADEDLAPVRALPGFAPIAQRLA